jgi:hypothetical protein
LKKINPNLYIKGSVQPGNCWSFKGSKADLFIKLAAKITATSFSLEHIPKELSLTGVIDSAPQNFTVYVRIINKNFLVKVIVYFILLKGYVSKDDIRDDNRYLLGNFRYDNNSKSTLQFFNVQVAF